MVLVLHQCGLGVWLTCIKQCGIDLHETCHSSSIPNILQRYLQQLAIANTRHTHLPRPRAAIHGHNTSPWQQAYPNHHAPCHPRLHGYKPHPSMATGMSRAHVVVHMLSCTCCRAHVAHAVVHMLSCTCCHMLSCTCCRAHVVVHMLSYVHMLSCSCCRAHAVVHMLSCTCCRAHVVVLMLSCTRTSICKRRTR